MPKTERLVSVLRLLRRALGAFAGRITIGGRAMMPRTNVCQEGQQVDISEFVAVSRKDVDPVALASQFEREFEQSLSDHRMTREQLETPVSV